MPRTFVLSTSDVNSYGFRVLTSGIELPESKMVTMLWGHLRGTSGKPEDVLPIGKWVNLRIDGDRLLGDTEFDEGDPFALEISRKVEKGYINEASAGLMPKEWKDSKDVMLKGQTFPTLAKSKLREASIVTIASNESAIALFDNEGHMINLKDGEVLLQITQLSKSNIPTKMDELKLVALALGLSDGADQTKVLATIQELKEKSAKLTILEGELKLLKDKEAEGRKAEIVTLLDAAVTENRITQAQRPVYQKLFDADFDSAKAAVDGLPKVIKLSDVPAPQGGGSDGKFTYQGKTFSQLSKDEPKILETLQANDLVTFKQLYKAEFGREYKETVR